MSKFVAIDTDILIYWVNVQSAFHNQAVSLFDKLRLNNIGVIVTWQNLTEFYAVVTDKKRYASPMKSKQVVEWIKSCLNDGIVMVVLPNERTGEKFMKLVGDKLTGQQVHDVYLAATLMANGLETLVSVNGRDFEGIKDLKVVSMEEFLEAK